MAECLSLNGQVFDAILSVFCVLVTRSCKVEEQSCLLVPLMNKMEFFGMTLQSLVLSEGGYSDETYGKLKKLAQFYHDLGVRQLTYKKTQLLNDKNFLFYLQGALVLSSHESDCVCSMMLELWTSALKSENFTKVHWAELFFTSRFYLFNFRMPILSVSCRS